MIILVQIIHDCYYSCLVFLFTGKLNQTLAPLATPGLRFDYKPVTSKLSEKQNVTSKDNNFWGFITINNISTLFFNWKIAVIPLLVLLIITNVLLFNKIEWKILLPMILAVKFFYTSNYSLVQCYLCWGSFCQSDQDDMVDGCK